MNETTNETINLHYGIGIPMEFSFYKDKRSIKKGDSISINDCKMPEVVAELESLFGKLSCHDSINDFELSANAFVYEIPDSAEGEMTSDLLASSIVPEDDTQKRCFFEKMLNAPKCKEYPVLAFDWKEQRIVFYGMYKLYPIESCMQQRVVMKFTGDTFTIKNLE